ncbi:MAG: helix-turn-helix domain-containing protein [Lachnospiraceae bacterium]|jgi:transcriptional regulator with XRE-family HTH domain|nr:helix-turn-helix domain-containing protein [Lachnospiraceae bacterium]
MDAIEIGSFLGELRKQKGLKQKEVAEVIQVSDKAVSRWETGRGIPDVDSLQRLSDFYEVSINEILAGRRIQENEVEKVADRNLKVMVKKQFSLKKKLFFAALAVVALLILLVVLVPVNYMGVSIVTSYCISGDDSAETLDKLFQDVAKLDEEGMEYRIMLDTISGEKVIYVVVILPEKRLSMLSSSKFTEEQGRKLSGEDVSEEDIVESLKEIGYL